MTILLQLRDGKKRYGGQVLLDEASFSIAHTDKVGLIGRNGAGKSTLCRILTGAEEMEEGDVVRAGDLRLGYLRQEDPYLPRESVMDFLKRDTGLEAWRCGEMAGRFEIKSPRIDGPVEELSGGWQTRVKLAALLLHEPNLLLLDEPTNFLDLRTQLLLENFLRSYRGACLIVSHDRTFLRHTCSRTLDLSKGQILQFSGHIDAYLEHRRSQRAHDERFNTAIAARQKQLQRFIDRNRANPKTSSQARSKAKQLARLELKVIEDPLATAMIHVPLVTPRKGTALACHDLAIGYAGHEVARGIRLELLHGARVVVVGDNGQGKTTLLNTLAGVLPPRSGGVRWGFGCRVGVYAQRVYASLPEHLTVLAYLDSCAAPGTSEQTVRNVAGSFLFRGDDVEKGVNVLSGGERARLSLGGLLLGGHNVLVLDEPGNHLDVETVEALANALVAYKGTVLFTSHDRHFTQKVATDVVEVCDGRVAALAGSYEDYRRSMQEEIDGSQPSSLGRPGKRTDVPDKEKARQRFRMAKEATALERRIERIQNDLRRLDTVFRDTTDPKKAHALHEEMTQARRDLSRLEDEWLVLVETIEEG
jgi:ATP-binding cassette subfamily F protein 3